jgi:hypothetical protein
MLQIASDCCHFCGNIHPNGVRCPQVSAYQYGADGRLVRIEFFDTRPPVTPDDVLRKVSEAHI